MSYYLTMENVDQVLAHYKKAIYNEAINDVLQLPNYSPCISYTHDDRQFAEMERGGRYINNADVLGLLKP